MLQPELFSYEPPKTRFLCIHLPHWPLAKSLRRTPARWREPLAVANTVRGRAEVVDATDAAVAGGVRVGVSVAECRALCPALKTLPADFAGDRRALEGLGRWMTRYTPAVAVGWDATPGDERQPPPALFLDVTGCERLFGSVRAIVKDVRAAMTRFRLPARVAAAPTVGAAWAIAAYRKPSTDPRPLSPGESVADRLLRAVRPLPVEALRLDDKTTLTLRRLLLTTAGHVLDLPRDTLPSRFGPQLLLRIDQLLGTKPELLTPLAYDPPVEARMAFEGPVDTLEGLWLVLHELLRRIVTDLDRRGRGARHVELHCTPERPQQWPTVVRHVHLTRPSRDPARLFELLRATSDKLDCGEGFVAVRLKVVRHDAMADVQASIESELQDRYVDPPVDDTPDDDRVVLGRIGPRELAKVPPRLPPGFAEHALRSHQDGAGVACAFALRDGSEGTSDAEPRTGVDASARGTVGDPIPLFPHKSSVLPRAVQRLRSRRPTKTELVPDDPEVDRLVDCLRARFGVTAVLQTRLVESHLPERAWHAATATAPATAAAVTARRPLRLLRTPEEIRVVAEPFDAVDARPAQFTHAGRVHRLHQVTGPERIAGEWWRNHHKTRDYYDAFDEGGRRFWLFRVVPPDISVDACCGPEPSLAPSPRVGQAMARATPSGLTERVRHGFSPRALNSVVRRPPVGSCTASSDGRSVVEVIKVRHPRARRSVRGGPRRSVMPEAPNQKLYKGRQNPPTRVADEPLGYAELDVTTNFSFLRGASHPDELVYTAAELGYRAMAVTDVNSVAGVVRAYEAAKKVEGFKLVVGCRLAFADGTPDVLVWPTDRAAYGRLCRLLTLGKRRTSKGECHLTVDDFLAHADGQQAAVCLAEGCDWVVGRLRDALGDRLSLAVHLTHDAATPADARLAWAVARSRELRVPLLATNAVHYHDPGRRALQDVLTCVRHGCTTRDAGFRLFANAERYLKSAEQMYGLFRDCRQAVRRALHVAAQCRFSLGELKYEYPTEAVPPSVSPSAYLRRLTYEEGAKKYKDGIPGKVISSIEKELAFICGSEYESYFLTVYDLVRFARSEGILCQGRGSAANSAVCYCLGVTSVDPNLFELVFSRFASGERAEPPDIDVDFEHERREEVIQYVYEKYGRDYAAMTGLIVTYRGRSAVRDVGKALGFSGDLIDQLADKLDWWHHGVLTDDQLEEAGVGADDVKIRQFMELVSELLGFPRHLSQHVGGMVISKTPLCELVPLENAAMEGRTVIEWDKDDLDVLKFFKVDILALGMLTAISKGLRLVATYDRTHDLNTIPAEDPAVYVMATDADTVGVFQIESRAQMAMLPRLRPRRFYDFVVEVAIVRPGPIQGGMVHPYLRRREEQRAAEDKGEAYHFDCERDELGEVLKHTLGVPLFQEQCMRMAIIAAGFTETEADQLRRSMAAWKRGGGVLQFEDKFIGGMRRDDRYSQEFAERCFKQICGFGEYGFPESHAASFAKLVYASAWIKRHHPAAFCCALMNSQPMGFYQPAQLVRDAIEHGVTVRPADVNASAWDNTLEFDTHRYALLRPRHDRHEWGRGGPAVRVGFRQINGVSRTDADKVVAARTAGGPFASVAELQQRAGLHPDAVRRLAGADALASLGLSRNQAAWHALAATKVAAPLADEAADDQAVPDLLPHLSKAAEVRADYSTQSLSLKGHPVAFVRDELTRLKVVPMARLADTKHGRFVRVAGLVLLRQRPGTASGVVFITLEDETGIANLVIWSTVYEKYRRDARHAVLMQADGTVQKAGGTTHLVVRRVHDRTGMMPGVLQASRDFH